MSCQKPSKFAVIMLIFVLLVSAGGGEAYGLAVQAAKGKGLELEVVNWDHKGPILIGDNGEPYRCPEITRESMSELFGVPEDELMLVVEIGPGHYPLENHAPISRAEKHPEICFLLVERLGRPAREWSAIVKRKNCNNVRVIHGDAKKIIGSYIDNETVDIFLSDFPTASIFDSMVGERLKPGGLVVVTVDVPAIAESCEIEMSYLNVERRSIRYFRELFFLTPTCWEVPRYYFYYYQKPPKNEDNDSEFGRLMAQPVDVAEEPVGPVPGG